MKMTSAILEEIMQSSHKRNRSSTDDCEIYDKDVKKIPTRTSLKNSIMSKLSNFSNGPTCSSRSVKQSELKKMEYRKAKGLPLTCHPKYRIGLKDKLSSPDDKKNSKKINCANEIVKISDNLSSHFFATETEKVRNCKHCNHVAMTKCDYWEHLKIHIEENARWNCPLCKFISANKYHLMNHFREHVGSISSKSFKFVHSFWDKSKLCTQIKSLTEQLKLRNTRQRKDFHRLNPSYLECVSV